MGGDIYEGDFAYGQFHGHEKMTFADGSFFEGEYFKGEPVIHRNVFQLVDRLFFRIFYR